MLHYPDAAMALRQPILTPVGGWGCGWDRPRTTNKCGHRRRAGGDTSRTSQSTLKTNARRQRVKGVPVAAVLRLHRVERRSKHPLRDVWQRVPSAPSSLKIRKLNRVRPEGAPGRTQNQITKRTQFDPLFSTKTQNESQIPPCGGGLKSSARASGLSEGQRHALPCHRERKVALKPSRAALVGTPVGSSCCYTNLTRILPGT